ncbi:LANO_0C00584g1_1 [Lachancea nothofagi CBS 11611]|uniref:LANO_0C00584g1_1 n=1 Tax=Lachancea nothofagi CBS 11611 TaxID=1266666 RepID=A0A1G4J3I2_9SACH|nr:LANO_0C00584g1_1 [Lachancea nothofagi CBS 11611]
MNSDKASKVSESLMNILFSKFIMLDDLVKGLIFGVGAVFVVILTSIFLIKIMLMSQEQPKKKGETEEKNDKQLSNGRSTAASTAVGKASDEAEHAEHLLSRKVIPLRSNADFEEEMEISVMEED